MRLLDALKAKEPLTKEETIRPLKMRVYKHIQNRIWQYGKIIFKFSALGSDKTCVQTMF
jgi:hypothetical protein